jgi:hypothetical protein
MALELLVRKVESRGPDDRTGVVLRLEQAKHYGLIRLDGCGRDLVVDVLHVLGGRLLVQIAELVPPPALAASLGSELHQLLPLLRADPVEGQHRLHLERANTDLPELDT